VTAGTLRGEETANAVYLSDQLADAGLVLSRYQPQLVPEFRLKGDRGPLPSNPDGMLEGGLQSIRRQWSEGITVFSIRHRAAPRSLCRLPHRSPKPATSAARAPRLFFKIFRDRCVASKSMQVLPVSQALLADLLHDEIENSGIELDGLAHLNRINSRASPCDVETFPESVSAFPDCKLPLPSSAPRD
jgi:hypothetical protein